MYFVIPLMCHNLQPYRTKPFFVRSKINGTSEEAPRPQKRIKVQEEVEVETELATLRRIASDRLKALKTMKEEIVALRKKWKARFDF